MLDYRIDTFLTLYDEMNYRRTAERLSMTQPGVTQHIQYLERYYGIKLFEYDGRTLSRTEGARRLKRYFDSVRAEEAHLREAMVPSDRVRLNIGATKTIGEFVLVSEVRRFLQKPNHDLNFVVDNTEKLLQLLERSELDFTVIEGVFDKKKYGYHLYKKVPFTGVCAKNHPFAGRTVPLEKVFEQSVVVREKGSGTRRLLEQAVADRGLSLDSFCQCISVSNFSVICELVARDGFITFAYEPISSCRSDLASFTVEDMQIKGEFNFVYCSEKIARANIQLFMEP